MNKCEWRMRRVFFLKLIFFLTKDLIKGKAQTKSVCSTGFSIQCVEPSTNFSEWKPFCCSHFVAATLLLCVRFAQREYTHCRSSSALISMSFVSSIYNWREWYSRRYAFRHVCFMHLPRAARVYWWTRKREKSREESKRERERIKKRKRETDRDKQKEKQF